MIKHWKDINIYHLIENFINPMEAEMEGYSYFICGTSFILLISDSRKTKLSWLFYPIYLIFCVGVIAWFTYTALQPNTSAVEKIPTADNSVWSLLKDTRFLANVVTLCPLMLDIWKITIRKDKANKQLRAKQRACLDSYWDSNFDYNPQYFSEKDQPKAIHYLQMKNCSYLILLFVIANTVITSVFYNQVVVCFIINILIDIVSSIFTNKVFKIKLAEEA
jgi:hypothetical protein